MRRIFTLSGLAAGLVILSWLVFFLIPDSLSLLAFSGQTFLGGEVWRILTFPFAHVGFLHLAKNILGMAIVGVLAYEFGFRENHFLYSFFISGIVIALLQTVVAPELVTAGLSLGIYAVLGALVLKGSNLIPLYISAPLFSLSIFLEQLACPGCDWIATLSSAFHFAGFLAGMGVFTLIRRVPKKRVLAVQKL